jgi:hypothetical protein
LKWSRSINTRHKGKPLPGPAATAACCGFQTLPGIQPGHAIVLGTPGGIAQQVFLHHGHSQHGQAGHQRGGHAHGKDIGHGGGKQVADIAKPPP